MLTDAEREELAELEAYDQARSLSGEPQSHAASKLRRLSELREKAAAPADRLPGLVER